ncbi:MAG TPA: class I SAM-dependent methyltransferase [Candidatus Kapabacteria bacterium]|jgi:ubiquinone/menaquinone biosynthesis C-methylase UbiE
MPATDEAPFTSVEVKQDVHDYWNAQPCGTQFTDLPSGTKEFYEEVERFRYATQPFMERLAKFKQFRGKKLLEIGCGMGTDSLQFARNGAAVTGVDLTEEGPRLATERFRAEGLPCEFRTADAESLPFADNSFDVVYSFGVLHHTPNTQKAIDEVYRVLKPGGEAVIMLYHKHSVHTWMGTPVYFLTGLLKGKLRGYSEWVRVYDGTSNPLGKAYSRRELWKMFAKFNGVHFAVCDSIRRRWPAWANAINQFLFANWAGFWMMIYGTKP